MLKAFLTFLAMSAALVGFVVYLKRADCFHGPMNEDGTQSADAADLQRALLFTGILSIFLTFFAGFFTAHHMASMERVRD